MKRKLITLFLAVIMTLGMSATVFADDTVTINVTDPPQVGVINTLLEKAYKEQSTYPLSGAVFEVKHYPTTGSTSGTPIHTWRFRTTDLGNGTYGIDGNNPSVVSGTLIPYGSYKHVWPLGTYTIQEITPPTGYLKSDEIVTFAVTYNASGGQYDANVSGPNIPRGTNSATFKNSGVKYTDIDIFGNISAVKKDKDNNEASPQGDGSLAGIKFALVLRSQSEYALKNNISRLVKQGEVIQVFETDSNGAFSMTGNNLRYGTYELIELRKDSTIAAGDMYDEVGRVVE